MAEHHLDYSKIVIHTPRAGEALKAYRRTQDLQPKKRRGTKGREATPEELVQQLAAAVGEPEKTQAEFQLQQAKKNLERAIEVIKPGNTSEKLTRGRQLRLVTAALAAGGR